MLRICVLFFSIFLGIYVNSNANSLDEKVILQNCIKSTCPLDNLELSNSKKLKSFSSYLNKYKTYLFEENQFSKLEQPVTVNLKINVDLLIIGRVKSIILKGVETDVNIENNFFYLSEGPVPTFKYINNTELKTEYPSFKSVEYEHLSLPIVWIVRFLERLLTFIYKSIYSNWGIAIILLSLIIKVLLLPLTYYTTQLQKRVNIIKSQLNPKLTEIKSKYKGEEAHEKIMLAHKKLDVSPFYSMKPMFATLIQLPILIAVFNLLGQFPFLNGSSFLWIKDLSLPDTIGFLPSSLPLIGDQINLLPIIMTFIGILSSFLFESSNTPKNELIRQKRNLILMSFAFFVLFYSFPSSMVLYWTSANFLQIFVSKVFKI